MRNVRDPGGTNRIYDCQPELRGWGEALLASCCVVFRGPVLRTGRGAAVRMVRSWSEEETALHLACDAGDLPMCALLLSKGAQVPWKRDVFGVSGRVETAGFSMDG